MTDMQKRIDELSKQIDKEWVALNDQKMKIFNLTIERDTLVLKKEIEMKKVIGWLDHYYDRTYGSHDSPMNLDDLPAINNKFKTYLKGGES